MKPEAHFGRHEWRFVWPDTAQITLSNLSESSSTGLTCEIVVDVMVPPKPGRVYGPAKLNLLAARTVKSVASDCADRVPSLDWQAMMLQTVEAATRRWREGDPLTVLAKVVDPGLPRFLLAPFVEHDGTTVIFAPGGTGKSLFALLAAMAVSTSLVPSGVFDGPVNAGGPVAFLDWEADAVTQRRRLERMARGFGHTKRELPDGILYRKEMAPLRSTSDRLAVMFEREGVRMAVIDSVGLARGGAPESADETIRLFAAIRNLGVPVLAIDHVAKSAMKDQSGDRTAFGSVYTTNAARMTWSLQGRRDSQTHNLVLSLKCTKVNNGMPPTDRFLHVAFAPDKIQIGDWADRPTQPLTQADTLRQIIELTDARSATVAELCDQTGLTASNIRKVLSRHSHVFTRDGSVWRLKADSLPNPMEV